MQDEYSIIGKILAFYPDMENITEDEQKFFNEWILNGDNKELFESIVDSETRKADFIRYLNIKEPNRENYYEAIMANLPAKIKVMWWQRWQTYVAAASIIAAISFIGLKWFGAADNAKPDEAAVVVKPNDVEPGQFRAKLTLADGSVIILDSAQNLELTRQGTTKVLNKDGKLVYDASGGTIETEIVYNTLTTAKGETYGTILSDGSKVWLNSKSSLRYPVNFAGDIRLVEVTGEAYFEVAKVSSPVGGGREGAGRALKPFIVKVNDIEVDVLGTHFNINSYDDELAIKTTLLEGKVRVRSEAGGQKSEKTLKPGQQAQLHRQTNLLKMVDEADVDEAVAWHYGYFQFGGADLQSVLRQISRWYDVEVVYQGNIPSRAFAGKISRASSLSQVLGIMESNDIHFKIEGKKIIVTP